MDSLNPIVKKVLGIVIAGAIAFPAASWIASIVSGDTNQGSGFDTQELGTTDVTAQAITEVEKIRGQTIKSIGNGVITLSNGQTLDEVDGASTTCQVGDTVAEYNVDIGFIGCSDTVSGGQLGVVRRFFYYPSATNGWWSYRGLTPNTNFLNSSNYLKQNAVNFDSSTSKYKGANGESFTHSVSGTGGKVTKSTPSKSGGSKSGGNGGVKSGGSSGGSKSS
jgi:hypothetical protein